MDSRTKIGASLPEDAHVVRGYFDPLLAEHARRLATCPRPLAVIVADPPSPLLPREARQLLVAALGCVDVVLADEAAHAHEDWTASDFESRLQFEAHVHNRTATGSF
ncbi:hypothetical protein F183_A45550 [Bryobacterales bacterium F-183]|nr:hypothetical protein F183_A45550 [Bryobacterales bacterium F-183]